VLIHIIADYGHGDLAFAEVVQRIKLHLRAKGGRATALFVNSAAADDTDGAGARCRGRNADGSVNTSPPRAGP
jgi:hypothetical protein